MCGIVVENLLFVFMRKFLIVCLFLAACGSESKEKKLTVCDCMKSNTIEKKQKECEELIMSLGYRVDEELKKCDFSAPRDKVDPVETQELMEVSNEIDTAFEILEGFQEIDSIAIKEKIEELNKQLEELRK
jgi:hypothetical protein